MQDTPPKPGPPSRQTRWVQTLQRFGPSGYWLDTRRAASRLLAPIRRNIPAALLKVGLSLLVAWLVASVPAHPGLEVPGRQALFVLVLAAGLWVSEAIPTFAVGLLVIALNVALLGDPSGPFAAGDEDRWLIFVEPWGSPLIWLFLGGFVLARAASKTGLDRFVARRVLGRFARRGGRGLLAGVMLVSFGASMVMSNTATTAMVLAMLHPVLERRRGQPLARALVLGAAFGANIGGMATVIGTPPNALAAAALTAQGVTIGFARWLALGLPPALCLAAGTWLFLSLRYIDSDEAPGPIDVGHLMADTGPAGQAPEVEAPRWHLPATALIVAITVLAWLSGSFHPVPTTVVALMPIAALTTLGILDEADLRGLGWDVLLLLAGGLSLGVAVMETGLAQWLVSSLPLEALGPLALAIALAYLTGALSNLMSNTATANILIPLALAAGASAVASAPLVVAVAMAASSSMAMPVSTPPNAIAYGTGAISTRDLLVGGGLIGLVAPLLIVGWVWLALAWLL